MISKNEHLQVGSSGAASKIRSYAEVVEHLNGLWKDSLRDPQKVALKKLDAALQHPSQKVKVIAIAGTNGKSLTANFVAQLLKQENLKVGAFYSPHILTYNERFAVNNETVSNTTFQDLANEVINTAEQLNLKMHARELLTMMALHYFAQQKVDVAVLEVAQESSLDPVLMCTPIIAAITRVNEEGAQITAEKSRETLAAYQQLFAKDTWIVSADQSKMNLQTMEEVCSETGSQWAMPIRKLAALSYPFEQLHGRCAALAERIAQLYVEKFTNIGNSIHSDSLLAKVASTRGRPTREAKRQAELHPRRTIEQFWKETTTTLTGRFQLLSQEAPLMLLDNASNFDAFKNLLLGIRLLHYQHPLKGLVVIVGCEDNELHTTEFFKLIRYFFKKTSGQIIFCPVAKDVLSPEQSSNWNVEQITNDVKNGKVKARSTKNLAEALDAARKMVDEKHGLIVVSGSRSIISEYWQLNAQKNK